MQDKIIFKIDELLNSFQTGGGVISYDGEILTGNSNNNVSLNLPSAVF